MTRFTLYLGPLLLLLAGTVLDADEPSQKPSPAPGEEAVAEITPRQVVELSGAVAESLRKGELNADVLQRQQSIVDGLRQLLASSSSSSEASGLPEALASSRPGQESSTPQSGQGTSQSGEGNQGRNSSGTESSGAPRTESPEILGDLRRRDGLADAVWGHLPPRIRDELYRSYTERYVPQYDSLLRRYFEKLAEDSAGMKRTD